MRSPPGLFGSFSQGMGAGQQFMQRRQQMKRSAVDIKQAKEDLLKSEIMDKYLGRQQEAKLQRMGDFYRAAQDAHQSALSLAPYLGPEKAARVRELELKNKFAPREMKVKERNSLTKLKAQAAREKRGGRFSQDWYKAARLASAAGAPGRTALFGGAAASPYTNLVMRSIQSAANKGVPGVPQGAGAPRQDMYSQYQQYLSQPERSTGAPGQPVPVDLQGGAPLAAPGAEMQQRVPQVGPAGNIPPPPQITATQVEETASKVQLANQIAANKKAVAPQIWQRWENSRINDTFWNDPKVRNSMEVASQYAGTPGMLKKWRDRVTKKGSKEYTAYQQLKKITQSNISNQLRQMEGLSIQSEQRKELQAMITGWETGLDKFLSNPEQALAFMNESGRQANVIARALEKESHPIFDTKDPIKEWVNLKPIQSKSIVAASKLSDEEVRQRLGWVQ